MVATTDSTIPLRQCSSKENCIHPEARDGWLPATTDYFNKANKINLRTDCKKCQQRYVQEWRSKNPKKARELSRRYYAKNPEKRREATRRWNANNPERRLQNIYQYHAKHPDSSRRWRVQNPERVRANARRLRAENPEKFRAYDNTRRARQLSAMGSHTREDITAQYQRQKGRCYYCNCKLDNGYHVDHVIPLSRGGTNDPSNLVIACPTCNQSKGAKLLHEWKGSQRLL